MITYNIFPRYTIPKSCFRSQQDTIPNDGEIYADYILQVANSRVGRWDGGLATGKNDTEKTFMLV